MPTTKLMSEGVKILFKGAIDNIIFLKRQQWLMINYSLLVFVGLTWLARTADKTEKTLLTIAVSVLALYTFACVLHCQHSMTKLRRNIWQIAQTHFSANERVAYRMSAEAENFAYGFLFWGGLLVADTFGAAAAIYLIWRLPFALAAP